MEGVLERVIQPSSSLWALPVVSQKKDGTVRFCVNYRKVNSVTNEDAYPRPRLDDLLDALAGSKYFCTLDLRAGCWQSNIAPEDREKTAFFNSRCIMGIYSPTFWCFWWSSNFSTCYRSYSVRPHISYLFMLF